MKFRGKQYNDYDIEGLISDAWDDAMVGESRAVYMTGYLPEACYEDVSTGLRDILYGMLRKREGVAASAGGSYGIVLDQQEADAVLRFIVDKIMFSLVHCRYARPEFILGLVGEWIAKETMNG